MGKLIEAYADKVDRMLEDGRTWRVLYIIITRIITFTGCLLLSILTLFVVPIIFIDTMSSWKELASAAKRDAIFNIAIFTVVFLLCVWGANFSFKVLKYIAMRWRLRKGSNV